MGYYGLNKEYYSIRCNSCPILPLNQHWAGYEEPKYDFLPAEPFQRFTAEEPGKHFNSLLGAIESSAECRLEKATAALKSMQSLAPVSKDVEAYEFMVQVDAAPFLESL